MATRPFISRDNSLDGVLPADDPQRAGRTRRYQLNVVATSLTDVVMSAGGWLCDRARAGWDVNVLVADRGDARPLTILGATALQTDGQWSAAVAPLARKGALAVSAELPAADAGVRSDILNILKRGGTEVTVWGQAWPVEFGRRVDPVEHRLSAAARAFKSHALTAAAVSGDSGVRTETLFRIGTGSFRTLYSV